MPNTVTDGCQQAQALPEENLIDTLIALSVVAKRLASKLQNENTKGEKNDE